MVLLRGFEDIALEATGAVVSIGNFDGVHRGHQAVIGSAVAAARRTGLSSVVCTFDPHTRVFLTPQAPPRLLETLEQRVHAIESLGVDVTVIIPFDRAVAELPRDQFVSGFLGRALHAVELHVSESFRFGAGGQGNVEYLRQVAGEHGFGLHVVRAVMAGERPVSSTRIRDAIAEGHVEIAAEMLGRPFAVCGEVVAGAGRGRDLRARTANLSFDGRFLPAHGVYVTEARLDQGAYPAVTNVGVRPTFGAHEEVTVETHLLDREADLYGERMELAFLKRLRGEIRFDGPEALAAQIRRDIEQAAAYFAATPRSPAGDP